MPARRVKWAYQISGTLHHVHRVAHTYHGYIKEVNVVLDEHDNAVLTDFEQGRANNARAAPEVRAGWSPEPSESPDTPLRYRQPLPGEKIGMLCDREFVYDAWRNNPRAIEAAEVHTLGAMLEKMFPEGEIRDDILQQCREVKPDARPKFTDIEQFYGEWYTSIVSST